MKQVIALLFITSFICAASAFANDLVDTLDKNKDQLISAEEAKMLPVLQEKFESLDINQDGQLDMEELKTFQMAE